MIPSPPWNDISLLVRFRWVDDDDVMMGHLAYYGRRNSIDMEHISR